MSESHELISENMIDIGELEIIEDFYQLSK